ncbi:MAG: DUF362 domain-containing protein, partial [Candidatus Lokiarchaeota archaeon]
KVQAHMGKKFEIDFSKCEPKCTKCVDVCPTRAMSKDKDLILKKDWDKCRYCYMCRSVCDKRVIDIGYSTREQFNMQFTDNAKGVVEYFGKDKIFFINYAIDISWQCDCGSSDIPFVPDIGVLSSLDPVALDQACIDLVHDSYINPNAALADIDKFSSKTVKDEWFSYIPRYDPDSGELDMNKDGVPSRHWEIQLETADELGLVTRNYNLIKVGTRNYNLIKVKVNKNNNHTQ